MEPPFTTRVLKSVSGDNPQDESSPAASPTAEPSSSSSATRSSEDTRVEPFTEKSEYLQSLLPASYRTVDGDLASPRLHAQYVSQELDMHRLNIIHRRLWMAGRPVPPRALHYQKLLGRAIVITEQMDMHLVWTTGQIFLKPIPRFLLEPDFWRLEIMMCDANGKCKCTSTTTQDPHGQEQQYCLARQNRRRAMGFLLSYIGLIAYESDFRVAQESRLVPSEVQWHDWRTLVAELLERRNIYNDIDKRFIHGELRLDRLNKIYRYTGISFYRGYKARYTQYSDFFREKFTELASLLVCVAVVMAAMQVGLATNTLQQSPIFQSLAHHSTLAVVVGPFAAGAAIIVWFVLMFLDNWRATTRYKKKRIETMDLAAHLSGR